MINGFLSNCNTTSYVSMGKLKVTMRGILRYGVTVDSKYIVLNKTVEYGDLEDATLCPTASISLWWNHYNGDTCVPNYQYFCPGVPVGYALLIFGGAMMLLVTFLVSISSITNDDAGCTLKAANRCGRYNLLTVPDVIVRKDREIDEMIHPAALRASAPQGAFHTRVPFARTESFGRQMEVDMIHTSSE